MRKPHKHAALIKAWADGAEIEYRDRHNPWTLLPQQGDWDDHPNFEYRIKPEPKPDYVEYFWATFTDVLLSHKRNEHNLKLTFDSETGKLKSAEVI